jgi:hypothetical protein
MSQGRHSTRGISEDKAIKNISSVNVSLPNNNYQTAKFGAPKPTSQSPNHNTLAMYTSMSDIGFGNKHTIVTKELRDKMISDSQNNWKVRTETIDMIA